MNPRIEYDCDLSVEVANGTYPLLMSLVDENNEEEQWFIAGYQNLDEGIEKILAYEALEYSGDEHNQSIRGIEVCNGTVIKNTFSVCVEQLLSQCRWFEKNKRLLYMIYIGGVLQV